MAQVATLTTREETLRAKLLQALQDYSHPSFSSSSSSSSAAGAGASSSTARATENCKLNELVAIACETLARLWQGAQLHAASEAYPLTRHEPPLPPTPAARRLLDQHAGQVRAAEDQQSMGSVLDRQRRNLEEASSGVGKVLSPTRPSSSASTSTAVRSKTGLVVLSPAPDSKSPGGQLQARLKRAQMAFASMRESHE